MDASDEETYYRKLVPDDVGDNSERIVRGCFLTERQAIASGGVVGRWTIRVLMK